MQLKLKLAPRPPSPPLKKIILKFNFIDKYTGTVYRRVDFFGYPKELNTPYTSFVQKGSWHILHRIMWKVTLFKNIVNKQYNDCLTVPFQDGHYKRYTDIHIKKNTVIANIFISKPFPFLWQLFEFWYCKQIIKYEPPLTTY